MTTKQKLFALDLSAETIARLSDYYELIQIENPLLHLVAPCPPEEFAVRHVLESLTLLAHLPHGATFADIGAGAGLPSIPCLLVREDLRGVLIESKIKKSVFLREAVAKLDLQSRVEIENSRFELLPKSSVDFVTCRALDKFAEKLAELVAWANRAEKFFLFGGAKLRGAIEKLDLEFEAKLLPESEQRYLFVVSQRKKYGKAL